MNKFIVALLAVAISGCSGINRMVKEIQVNQSVEPVEILHPPLPDGVTWEGYQMSVLTPGRMRDLLAKLDRGELDERDLVFVGIKPQGYERLITNMADIKRFIKDQNAVIIYYRENVPTEIFLPKIESEDEAE